jgi:tetratricopeptide (TPR) repeat protein
LVEGKDLLEKSVKVSPNYVDAWFNLGNLYDKMGNYTEAIEAFQKLVSLRPEEGGFYYKLGILLLKKEMFDEALNAFLKAQKYAEDKYQPYYQAAIIYHMKKQIYWAVKNYKKAVALHPTHFESYLNLADIYLFELNDKLQAKVYYERARAIHPNDSYVAKRLQEIASGKYDYMKKKNLADFMPKEEKARLEAEKKKKNYVVSSKEYKSRLEKFKHGQVLYIKKVDDNSPPKSNSKGTYDSSFEESTPLPKNGKGGKYLQFSNPAELRELLKSEGIGK